MTERPDEELTLDAAMETLDALGGVVDALVEAWESADEPPELKEFLPPPGALRRLALVELIKVDLEYRWSIRGCPKHVEQYLSEFPELAVDGAPPDLLYEEYHVRKQAGLDVDAREFARRFPQQARQLGRLLGTQERATFSTAVIRPQRTDLLKELKPGSTFDDFDLLAFLGKGAFASVFLARQNSMQRLVALKVSAIRGSEHRTLAQFDHDHIVRIFDQRTLPEHRAQLLYMQYVPGPTLQAVVDAVRKTPPDERSGRLLWRVVDDALRERGESRTVDSSLREKLEALPWSAVVCWIGGRLASALDHAHRHGVLHRDVKPANVLLTADASPKLADFNVSFCSKVEGASPAAYFGGSLAYMSPEQLEACDPRNPRQPDSLDARSDVFSLGVMLWELLTGDRPYQDSTVGSQWSKVMSQLIRLRQEGPDSRALVDPGTCPAGVRRVLENCLHMDRERRWRDAADVARHLTFCADTQLQDYLHPPTDSWRRRVRPYFLFLVPVVTLAPSVLAAVFNFVYNWNEIIRDMSAEAQRHFMAVQGVINATAFPAGLALVAYLTYAALSATRGDAPVSVERMEAACSGAMRLGHRAALVCLILWTLAGLAYPLSMQLGRFAAGPTTYAHFFVSLVLCGLFAVSLTFFGVTSLMLRAALPALLEKRLPDRQAAAIESVGRWSWVYLAMSASVPMSGTVALVAVNSRNIRVYLGVISISGILAFALAVLLLRAVLRDLQLLDRVRR